MKQSGFRLLILLLSIGFVGVLPSTAQGRHDTSIDRATDEDNIREAVFRYRMNEMKGDSPIFLSINGKDPSDTFMARFADSKKGLKKASQSYVKKDPFPSLRDRATGQPGMSFSVGAITWVSSNHAEVRGGMYCGGLCADGGEYLLEKKQGHWVVTKYNVENGPPKLYRDFSGKR
jgi:hypothetical protein